MSDDSKQKWRRETALWRSVSLDNMRNSYTGMDNLVKQISLKDPRHSELSDIKRELEALHKRLLRVNLPQT